MLKERRSGSSFSNEAMHCCKRKIKYGGIRNSGIQKNAELKSLSFIC